MRRAAAQCLDDEVLKCELCLTVAFSLRARRSVRSKASAFYWSATSVTGTLGTAWFVLVIDGGVFPGGELTANSVRAVRGGL